MYFRGCLHRALSQILSLCDSMSLKQEDLDQTNRQMKPNKQIAAMLISETDGSDPAFVGKCDSLSI